MVRATTTKKFADNVVVKINGVTANVLSVDNNAGVLFESYFAIPQAKLQQIDGQISALLPGRGRCLYALSKTAGLF